MNILVVLLFHVQFWHTLSLRKTVTPPAMCDIPLADREAFTYAGRSWQNYAARWAAIRAELRRWRASQAGGSFSVVDVGSNRGFFSVQTAGVFPQALVIGVEGSYGKGNGNLAASGKVSLSTLNESTGVQNHLKWIQKLALPNSVIVPEVWDLNRITNLAKNEFTVDVMYLLSVFHWMDKYSLEAGEYSHKSHNTEDTVNHMAKILSLAQLHFIELPSFTEQNYFPQLRVSFKGSEELFLKEAVQRSGRAKTIKEIYSDKFHGLRRIFLIKDEDEVQTRGVSETLSHFDHVLPDRIESIPANQAPACT